MKKLVAACTVLTVISLPAAISLDAVGLDGTDGFYLAKLRKKA